MNIISVIPLARSRIHGTLAYWTTKDVPVGAIVSVPLRSKSIHGIVVKTVPAEDLKSAIKTAKFEIKRLDKVRASIFLFPEFIKAANDIAEYYATNVGSVIDTIVNDGLLENSSKIPPALLFDSAGSTSPDETYAVQGDDEDRISSWRSLIRQQFARKKSLAIYAPTHDEVRFIFTALEKGIEGYIFVLHGGLTSKKITETWTAIAKTAHPVVIIATGSFAVLPRKDIESIIIERENSRGWIGQKNPYLDMRRAIETLARKQRQTVFLADCLLRTETLYRLNENEITAGSPFKGRSISTAEDTLVDMRTDKPLQRTQKETDQTKPDSDPKSSGKTFKVLSPELERLITRNLEDNTHLFILTLRRGMSPTTVCEDCEMIVTCRNCSSPVILHKSSTSGRNYFMCHKCGERRDANETCKNCGSWRLTPLGIGIDKVTDEIRALHPKMDIFKVDADTTKTDKLIDDTIQKFRSSPGSILVGTEMALPHLGDKIEHIAIASIDSLFALPDFRIQEKIMYLLIRLRAMATISILVQTRKPEEKVFEFGLKGNLNDFFRTTLVDRKQFEYPPYSTLVKITLEGKKDAIASKMAEIQKQIDPVEMDIFPAFTATLRGNSVIHGLIKLQPRSWPDPDLLTSLLALPPEVVVKIDPDSLL